MAASLILGNTPQQTHMSVYLHVHTHTQPRQHPLLQTSPRNSSATPSSPPLPPRQVESSKHELRAEVEAAKAAAAAVDAKNLELEKELVHANELLAQADAMRDGAESAREVDPMEVGVAAVVPVSLSVVGLSFAQPCKPPPSTLLHVCNRLLSRFHPPPPPPPPPTHPKNINNKNHPRPPPPPHKPPPHTNK